MSPARASAALRDAILRAQGIEPPKPVLRFASKCCPACGTTLGKFTAIQRIQTVVADYYGLPADAMVSQRQGRAVAHPRQVAMFLCRELTPRSFPEIGRRFGNRDHTTVMYAIRAVKLRSGSDASILADIDKLKARLDPSVDNVDKCQITSKSLTEHGKEHLVNNQVETMAA